MTFILFSLLLTDFANAEATPIKTKEFPRKMTVEELMDGYVYMPHTGQGLIGIFRNGDTEFYESQVNEKVKLVAVTQAQLPQATSTLDPIGICTINLSGIGNKFVVTYSIPGKTNYEPGEQALGTAACAEKMLNLNKFSGMINMEVSVFIENESSSETDSSALLKKIRTLPES